MDLEELIQRAGGLPALPATHHKLMSLLTDEDYSTDEVARVISSDPALSIKVLKLANSSLYGLNRMVDSVQKAVVILGGRELIGLTLTTAVLDSFGEEFENPYFSLVDFWAHSKATAVAASLLVKKFGRRNVPGADVAWAAGLMHDIGRLLLIKSTQNEYAQVLDQCKNQNIPLIDAENDFFGFSNSDLGAALAESWNLPQSLTHAIQYHHHPENINPQDRDFSIVYIIHLADYLAKEAGFLVPNIGEGCTVHPKVYTWSKFIDKEQDDFVKSIQDTFNEISL
jgi:HD-like signal output (HDOD) protein